MRRTTSALAAAPDAHGSVAAGVGKISKTTPCKAAGSRRHPKKRLTRRATQWYFLLFRNIASAHDAVAKSSSSGPITSQRDKGRSRLAQ